MKVNKSEKELMEKDNKISSLMNDKQSDMVGDIRNDSVKKSFIGGLEIDHDEINLDNIKMNFDNYNTNTD